MRKRIMAILIVLCIVVLLVPAVAAEGPEDQGLPDYGFFIAPHRTVENLFADGSSYAEVPVAEDGMRYLYLFSKNGNLTTTNTKVSIMGPDSEELQIFESAEPNNNYIKIELPDPQESDFSLEAWINNAPMCWVTINPVQSQSAVIDEACKVGFGYNQGEAIGLYEGGIESGGSADYKPDPSDVKYEDYTPMYVYAVTYQGTEGNVEKYVEDTSKKVTVKSVTLAPLSGNPNTFSLDAGTTQSISKTESISNPFNLYYSKAYTGAVYVNAVVDVDGKEYKISTTYLCNASDTDVIDCTGLDTIETVNERLSEHVNKHPGMKIDIQLSGTYTGSENDNSIVIPDGLVSGDDLLRDSRAIKIHGVGDDPTIIKGSLQTASAAPVQVYDLTFQAPDNTKRSAALSGSAEAGALFVDDCTFNGYGVGVDCSASFIGAADRNTFVDNEVGIYVNLGNCGVNQGSWANNSFQNNDVAVQIVSLNDNFPPFICRICDSNFIGNDTDFDVSGPAGDYYFYRNLFCDNSLNLRGPVKKEGSGVKLHCYPARDSSGKLILSNDNTILNSASAELTVGEDQLPGKSIHVVDDTGAGANAVGTWMFPQDTAAPLHTNRLENRMLFDNEEAPTGFNAGLEISTGSPENTVTVTVKGSTDILSTKRPTLTIPCPVSWTGATVTGPDNAEITDVSFDTGNHEVTFLVAEKGAYTITHSSESLFKVSFESDVGSGTMADVYAKGNYKLPECSFTAPSGKIFDHWLIEEKPYSVGDTITVNADVTVTAAWKDKPIIPSGSSQTVYQILVEETPHGVTAVSKKTAVKGSNVTITTTPDEHYELDTLTVKNAKGEEIPVTDNVFTMPASKVTVTATYKLRNPFEDISKDDPYYDAVLWAYYHDPQITTGTDETHFEPDAAVKRGEAVTFLWRALHQPEPEQLDTPFEDLSDDYYLTAVAWAVETGVTRGTDATHFSPEDTLTTAHMITFLYRALNPGRDGWFEEAAAWAEENGLLAGFALPIDDETPCLRAEVVKLLSNVYNQTDPDA